MADLIDRENATKLINELLEDIHRGKIELHKKNLEQLAINITCLPPADTERHAHWLYRSTNRFYECSYCGNITYSSEDKYCSNCGCGMDKVKE